MSNREAKSQARQWSDSPEFLAEDLRKLLIWIEANAFVSSSNVLAGEALSIAPTSRTLSAARASEVIKELHAIDRALWEYRRMIPETRVPIDMLQPLTAALSRSEESLQDLPFEGLAALEEAVSTLERWAKKQSYKTSDLPVRSELLKTTIEELGGELIIRTDKDGSTKIRGAVNIPMFLAFWCAPKHRLTKEAFQETDPGTKYLYLDRHRARLCSQLQDILLELVVDGNSIRLQRCRS